mgnify:CR=1 FL=1
MAFKPLLMSTIEYLEQTKKNDLHLVPYNEKQQSLIVLDANHR